MLADTKTKRTLVIGALGQIGSELIAELTRRYGNDSVVATDIRLPEQKTDFTFLKLDVLDKQALYQVISDYNIGTLYNLAAILSAKGEQQPQLAWEINMKSLLNTLEAARELSLEKVFWPSSIAVFGPSTPRVNTPQHCEMDPSTVYGISKLAGERWCAYYAQKYGVDVRSLRYPGLISYKTLPGGGTTDYAVEIFHEAVKARHYTSFLGENTALPMMYMPDAIRATLSLMDAPVEAVKVRSSYNLAGISFTPAILAAEIQKHIPLFSCDYKPDFRQAIAESWPQSIDDRESTADWGWKPEFDLESMAHDMLLHIREFYTEKV
ncbi:MAG: NAD-dependent epimerase/dehydratase family protein [Bacteroidia bacterium]|nr:NAD-dependent epimerase/dehydratase family protein [Bacteroidia bacterium]